MGSERSLHMEPSPLPVLKDSSSEGLAPDAPHVQLPRGWRSSTGSTVDSLEQFLAKPTRNRGPQCFYPFEVRTQEETGSTRRLIESSECVRGRPARQLYKYLSVRRHEPAPRRTLHSRRVSSQPERARHTLCLISQGDGIH